MTVMLRTGLYCLAALLLLLPRSSESESPLGGGFETISISAEEASEDIRPGILHFKGQFVMQTPDWRVESERATVYGRPDRPDKVSLQGSPARFLITRHDNEHSSTVEAYAPRMEYTRSTEILRLSDGATLKLDEEVIQSEVIEYNVKTERYRAGGADGVLIEVPPVD